MDEKEMVQIIIGQAKRILKLEKECEDKERAYNEEFNFRKELQDKLKEDSKCIKIDILEEFYQELQQNQKMTLVGYYDCDLSKEIYNYAIPIDKITKLFNDKIEEILNGTIQ